MSSHEPVYLTDEGLKNLHQELEHLTTVKRSALADRLFHAIRQGDLSENADYITAKEEQGFLEGRIQQIEVMVRNAVLIEGGPSDQVVLGSRVTVVEQGFDDTEVYRIVGPAEADPSKGNVSNESPLGTALMGHQIGDTVAVKAPAGEISFRIAEIR